MTKPVQDENTIIPFLINLLTLYFVTGMSDNGYLVVIEAKGFENDSFYLKKKMFRKWLEGHYPKSIYFEIYTKKQLLQAVEIIKALN